MKIFCTVPYLRESENWHIYWASIQTNKARNLRHSYLSAYSKINSCDHGLTDVGSSSSHKAAKHQNMSKCANWQTADCLWMGDLDSVAVRECAYSRTQACRTVAVRIGEQELMRRVTDGAACLCQQSAEVQKTVWLGAKRLREARWRERELGAGDDGKCQMLLSRTGLISTQTALHLGGDPCRSTTLPPLTHQISKSTSRRLHTFILFSFFFLNKQDLPGEFKINWGKINCLFHCLTKQSTAILYLFLQFVMICGCISPGLIILHCRGWQRKRVALTAFKLWYSDRQIDT